MSLNNLIDAAVEKNNDALVKSLQELIRINSVYSEPKPGMPYGEGAAKALENALNLCASLGFRTKNLDNYVGYAEIGEGEEMFGIVVHLDVVPEGSGWLYPPYSATIADGKLYGRGAIDDKGPAVSCIYAVKSILDAGVVPNKRIRIIFGADEETAWRDVEHYMEAGEEIPTCGIAPDANFPVIFAEEALLGFGLVMDKTAAGIEEISGGTASNAVPDSCKATVIDKNGNPVTIETAGVAAHASLPHLGENAISKLMEELYAKHESGEINCPLSVFYHEKIGMDYYGEKLGFDVSDDSGRFTCNVGVARIEDNNVVLEFDMRVPVSLDPDDVTAKMKEHIKPYGLELVGEGCTPSVFMDKNGEMIKTLMNVYREITGDTETEPMAIGGATFARAFPNTVAFGALFPGRPMTEHQKNEHIELEDLTLMTKIYAQAIALLTK